MTNNKSKFLEIKVIRKIFRIVTENIDDNRDAKRYSSFLESGIDPFVTVVHLTEDGLDRSLRFCDFTPTEFLKILNKENIKSCFFRLNGITPHGGVIQVHGSQESLARRTIIEHYIQTCRNIFSLIEGPHFTKYKKAIDEHLKIAGYPPVMSCDNENPRTTE